MRLSVINVKYPEASRTLVKISNFRSISAGCFLFAAGALQISKQAPMSEVFLQKALEAENRVKLIRKVVLEHEQLSENGLRQQAAANNQ